MKLIKPSYKIIEQNPGLNDIYEAIESAGRTCYKSRGTRYFKIPLNGLIVPDVWDKLKLDTLCDKYIKTEGDGLYPHCLNGYVSIADEAVKLFPELVQYESEFNPKYHKNIITAKDFVDRMIKSGNCSMLEFGTVYLKFNSQDLQGPDFYIYDKYIRNPYSKVTIVDNGLGGDVFISTNYRVLVENGWLDDLNYLCEPTEYHEKRVCVGFTTDRGVSHELVKHRVFSFAQESTKYCLYNIENVTFIIPGWSNLKEGFYATSETITFGKAEHILEAKYSKYDINENNFDKSKTLKCDKKTELLISSLKDAEYTYLQLIENNCKPQEARQVLPNALKTEINMCGFVSDWKHFFKFRDAEGAHPDMIALIEPLYEEFDRTYFNN